MDNLTMLIITIGMFVMLVIGLIIALFMMKSKKTNEDLAENKKDVNKLEKVNSNIKVAKEYETKSVFEFMEFENVKDNMIIQKKGKTYSMAIECQGINYDLMSEVEQVSVEQGFSSFLNSLKDPIQIYIQTRTINLGKNIEKYKERLSKIKGSVKLKEYRLNQYLEQENKNEQTLKNRQLEVIRENNLFEYAKDIIASTERMSLNKNVLRKKYYIVLKYFYEPVGGTDEDVLSEEEISDVAFSNLYTRAASIIRVLAGIGIVGKTLDSFELVDLLYNAYNRDESEVFGVEKAIDSGYNEIYIDAQSSIDKKISALNREIQIKAEEKALNAVQEVINEDLKHQQEIENNIDQIILDLAQKMIEDEKNNLPEEIQQKAVKKLQKKGEKEKNEQKTTRKRKAS